VFKKKTENKQESESTTTIDLKAEINVFPNPRYSAGTKEVFYERDDCNLVFLFEYDVTVDDNYMEHSSNIYFHTQTKEFVYRQKMSTILGFSSGAGWGFDKQYEVTYDYVQEIMRIVFDSDGSCTGAETLQLLKLRDKIQMLMNS